MDLAKYKKIFLEESREHLQKLNEGFVVLEREAGSLEGIDELFRHAHSMKGMSSSMGYEPITRLSHAMEDALDRLKRREAAPTAEIIDLLLASVDRLEKMVEEVSLEDAPSTASDDLVERLRVPPPSVPADEPAVELEEVVPEAASGSADLPVPVEPHGDIPAKVAGLLDKLDGGGRRMLEELLRSGLVPSRLEISLDPDSSSPAARAFIILNRLSKAGILASSTPDLAAVKRGEPVSGVEALVLHSGSREELKATIAGIPEVTGVTVEGIDAAVLRRGAAPVAPAAPARPSLPAVGREVSRKLQTVRVDTAILDRLINIVGEMLISHERLWGLSAPLEKEDLSDEVLSLGGMIHRFQEEVMGVRMIPLDLVAGRFPRMVRDLAHRSGKEVAFEAEGLEIELDRSILEEVGEVLVHVLRNSVDHGLETPEERLAAGKERMGTVRFRAYREQEWVFVEISDDGRGIDLAGVRQAALEKGLVSPELLQGMDAEETMMLVTLPGFSTAREVTEISGRGVGLDAVRTKVESLGGSVLLRSVPGEGTTVVLRIPFTLAIVRLLLVAVGGERYGLPINRVQRTMEVRPKMLRVDGDREYVQIGRTLVRLLRLSALLGREEGPWQRGPRPAVMAVRGRRRYGLLVDGIMGTREAVIKPLGRPLSAVPALSGATILGDGSPMIVLDLQRLL